MAVNQASLNAAVTMLSTAVKTATCSADVSSYWNGILAKPYRLHANGTVQSTCSNPVAYFLVPLSGDGTKGRSHEFVLSQFSYALSQGWCKDAHVHLRGIDESAIVAGMSYSRARKDSMLGTVEGRIAAATVSATVMSDSAKGKAAKQVTLLDAAKIDGNRSAYSHSLDAIAALIAASEKRNAKVTVPVVTKPVQTAPEVVKLAEKRKGKGKAE